jgi:hypothetical protein
MGSAARFDAVRTCASHHDPINVVELDAPDDTRWTTKPDSVGATWFDGPAWTDAPSEVEQLVRSIRLFIDETKQRAVGQTSLGTANLLY